MADPENPDTTAKSDEAPAEKSGGGGAASGDIGLTMSYIISIPGILKIVEFVSTSIKCVKSFCSEWKAEEGEVGGGVGTNEDWWEDTDFEA